jgi:hypothetical protein
MNKKGSLGVLVTLVAVFVLLFLFYMVIKRVVGF